jgi:carbonic anhydrase
MTEADPDAELERLLDENRRYSETFDRSALTARPLSGMAVVACMDPRLDIEAALGLRIGDAHVIRNAGGLVTDDVVRSLVISTGVVGTRQVLVIGHTGCALHGLDEPATRASVAGRAGLAEDDIAPAFGAFGAFGDLEANVQAQVGILRDHPLLPGIRVHGLLYDVATGRLEQVA